MAFKAVVLRDPQMYNVFSIPTQDRGQEVSKSKATASGRCLNWLLSSDVDAGQTEPGGREFTAYAVVLELNAQVEVTCVEEEQRAHTGGVPCRTDLERDKNTAFSHDPKI
ncbi:hypothetical protein AOLI_G00187470 [Acnodon oligacanthus]